MQTLLYLMEESARILCGLRAQELAEIPENARMPTPSEMQKGIPEWFRVQEVARTSGNHIDKYYFSIDGQKFRSICAVKKWREKLQFELAIENTDEAPCF